MKEECFALLEQYSGELIQFGRALFDCPEPGFKEVRSSQMITSFLRSNGIDPGEPICLTGFKATIGDPAGYHIALAADMDAVLVTRDGRTYPYHSCGHSIQTAVMAYVMKILNDSGAVSRLGGCVSFIGTPAEEFIDFDTRQRLADEGKIKYFSGKQNMIAQGVFDDVDCVISMHINGDQGTLFDIGSTLAGFMTKKVTFTGKTSHSGAAPHLGRNALHGACLAMDAIAYMKDQFAPEAGLRLNPVLTDCGGSVNAIADRAVLETYIRANTTGDLMYAGERFDRLVKSCAEALELGCEIENRTGYMPLKQSDEINSVIYRQMLDICDEDKIVKGVVSGASGDVGDMGYILPTVQFGFSGMRGRFHSPEFDITDEENAYINTAKVLIGTVTDMLTDPALQVRAADREAKKEYYLKNWLHEDL